MKKLFIIAASALVAFSACNKNVAPVAQIDPDEIFDGTEKYPIIFGTNVVDTKAPATKGVGPVEAWTSDHKLHIYGVQRVNGVLDLSDEGILIDNLVIDAPTDTEPTVVYQPGTTEPYYYDYTAKYDFFGYYIDDAVPGDIANSGSAITLPITIDGTQDVMLAKASREGWTVQNTDTPVDPDKLFSAYGVRKGVNPNLVFEHQLTRLKFNIINGNGVAAEAEPTLFLESLSVTSPNRGTLGIIGAENLVVNTQSSASLALSPFASTGVVGTKPIGSILVMPGQTAYPLAFQLKQTGKELPVNQTETITLTGNTAFEAGKSYTVNLTIYGLEQIKITVALTPWVDGEVIDLGQDQD